MKKKLQIICAAIITLHLQLITHNLVSQNVGINSDGANPETNTMLDIKSTGTTSSTFGLKVKNSEGNNDFVVRSDGNVGLNTSSPNAKFFISNDLGGTDIDSSFFVTDFGGVSIGAPVGGIGPTGVKLSMYSKNSSVGMSFQYDVSTRYTIGAEGNFLKIGGLNAIGSAPLVATPWKTLGVGTTGTPNVKLEVSDDNASDCYDRPASFSQPCSTCDGVSIDVAADGTVQCFNTGTYNYALRVTGSSGTTPILFARANGNVGIGITTPTQALHVSGNGLFTGTVTASCGVLSCSDIRYKKDISPLTNSLEKVKQLQGVQYNWRKEDFPDKKFDDRQQIGVIAQELEKIYPNLVHTDDQGFKTVDYAHLTPILIEAIKEQQSVIETQKEQISTLTTGMSNIERRMKQLEQSLETVNK